jgi:hypothetical protein
VGLIRKSLNIGTAGVIKPESKKQRFARTAAGIPSQRERAAQGWSDLAALPGALRSAREESRERRRWDRMTPEEQKAERETEQERARQAAEIRAQMRAQRWPGKTCAYCGRPPDHPKHDLEASSSNHSFEEVWPR